MSNSAEKRAQKAFTLDIGRAYGLGTKVSEQIVEAIIQEIRAAETEAHNAAVEACAKRLHERSTSKDIFSGEIRDHIFELTSSIRDLKRGQS